MFEYIDPRGYINIGKFHFKIEDQEDQQYIGQDSKLKTGSISVIMLLFVMADATIFKRDRLERPSEYQTLPPLQSTLKMGHKTKDIS